MCGDEGKKTSVKLDENCDILGAVAPCAARNNITHLSVVSSRQRSYDRRRCEKNIVKYDGGILYEFSTTISKFA